MFEQLEEESDSLREMIDSGKITSDNLHEFQERFLLVRIAMIIFYTSELVWYSALAYLFFYFLNH